MTVITTCEQCGLNVPTSSTTYSLQGALLCRNCSDQDGMMQQTGRARASTAREVREEAGVRVYYVQSLAEFEQVDAEMKRLEAEFARDVSFTSATAQAVSFTCRPCGRTLPLEEGAYNPENRVLCETCFAADAERRRNARRSGENEWKWWASFIAFIVIATLLFYLRFIL